jgi:hypothetical protein
MRAARFMKWGATLVAGVASIVAIVIGATTTWYLGVLTFLIMWSVLFIYGYSRARCPRCGQVWWSGMGTLAAVSWWCAISESAEHGDETESFVCRRCRLDIGLALRND